jgi:hypothetical protein
MDSASQQGQVPLSNNGFPQVGAVGQPSQGVFYAFANNRSTDGLALRQPEPLSLPLGHQSNQSFQSYQYRVPLSIGDITNVELREQMIRTSNTATACQKELMIFNAAYRKRYMALCPRNNPGVFHNHGLAMARLFQWRDRYIGRHVQPPYSFPGPRLGMNETLAPPAKIPAFLVQGVVLDELAYRKFYTTICEMRDKYLAGPAAQWEAVKCDTEKLMLQTPLTDITRTRWLHEWLRWRDRATRWENAVEQLWIMTWEQISTEVQSLINVAAVDEREWEYTLKLSSVMEKGDPEYADLLEIPDWGR